MAPPPRPEIVFRRFTKMKPEVDSVTLNNVIASPSMSSGLPMKLSRNEAIPDIYVRQERQIDRRLSILFTVNKMLTMPRSHPQVRTPHVPEPALKLERPELGWGGLGVAWRAIPRRSPSGKPSMRRT